MASHTSIRIVALGLIVVAAGAGGYWLSRPESTPPIVGVVRTTEVRIAPEVAGQLTAIKVRKGDHVRAGDVVAELSAIELTASVGQARAALAAATADRNNVYAGVRAEQVASLKAEIAKAKSRLEYARAAAQPHRHPGAQRDRLAAGARPGGKRRGERTGRRRRGASQLRRRSRRADERGACHRGRAGQGGGVRARSARAAARQDHPAGAGRRHCQRDRRRGRGEHPRRPAGARDRGDRQAVAVVQRARRYAARPHGGVEGRRRTRRRRANQRRHSSPSWCRSGRSRPGRRSGRSAITTAARCACASTRRAIRPGSSPA